MMKIYSGKNLFLMVAKLFLPVGFYHGKKFFPLSGKNLPTVLCCIFWDTLCNCCCYCRNFVCCAHYAGESCFEVKASSNDITKHPHGDKPRAFLCKMCDKRFTTKASLMRHKSMHNRRETFASHSGASEFVVNVEAGRNDVTELPRDDKPRPYLCKVCNKRFAKRGSLRSHKLMHKKRETFAGHSVASDFQASVEADSNDVNNDEKPRPYLCKLCNKRFARRGSLRSHKLMHQRREMVADHSGASDFDVNVEADSNDTTNDDKPRPYLCKVCNKRFTRKGSLTAHKLLHKKKEKSAPYSDKGDFEVKNNANDTTEHPHDDNPRPYFCTQCDKQFTTKGNLNTHRLTHTGVKYSCTQCEKHYTTPQYLRKHMNVHSNKYKCTECGKGFQNNQGLKVHRQSHSAQKPSEGLMLYSCSQCDKRFPNPYRLNSHMNVHSSKFKCSDCEKCFRSFRELSLHTRNHSGEKPFECTVCGKRFPRAASLVVHSRIHSGDKPYKCLVCNRPFIQYAHLYGHMRVHMEERPKVDKLYKCSMCDESFTQSGNLRIHERRIHSSMRPYDCHHCGKTFKISKDLKHHLHIHSDAKRYSCKHCSDRFTWRSQLTTHLLKSHNEGTWLICHVCQKKFTYSSHLRVHLLRHEGVKLYLCSECPKCFYTAGELRDHQLAHSHVKQFCCGSCGKFFKRKDTILLHFKRCPSLLGFDVA